MTRFSAVALLVAAMACSARAQAQAPPPADRTEVLLSMAEEKGKLDRVLTEIAAHPSSPQQAERAEALRQKLNDWWGRAKQPPAASMQLEDVLLLMKISNEANELSAQRTAASAVRLDFNNMQQQQLMDLGRQMMGIGLQRMGQNGISLPRTIPPEGLGKEIQRQFDESLRRKPRPVPPPPGSAPPSSRPGPPQPPQQR